jgi:DNA recombination protein RmuC
MTEIGIGVFALAAGLALGVAIAALRRPRVGDHAETGRIEARLDVQGVHLQRLADAAAGRDLEAERFHEELSGARRALEELRVREQERRGSDDEQRDAVRRLATVLAGSASKGRAGEHVLREHLRQLPPAMLASDFRVNGKTVEFALLLPDGRRLPIDSKWPALAELEALEAAEQPTEREACARAVERVVTARAKEVAQYLDPALTAPMAVAAVPDAAFAVLRRAHADAYAKGVVIVPYSAALPIVLFLYALVQRFGEAHDVQVALADVAGVLDQMEAVVENKFARAATMLTNGADEFRSSLGKARGSIARARAGSGEDGSPESEGVLTLVH